MGSTFADELRDLHHHDSQQRLDFSHHIKSIRQAVASIARSIATASEPDDQERITIKYRDIEDYATQEPTIQMTEKECWHVVSYPRFLAAMEKELYGCTVTIEGSMVQERWALHIDYRKK